MISFNLLRISLSCNKPVGWNSAAVRKIVIGINCTNMEFGKQFEEFIQIFIFSCSECIGKRSICFMFNRPPKPNLMGFIMTKTPHFIHFGRCFNINIYLCRFFGFYCFKEIFIYLFREIFCFFKTPETVSFAILSTLPVSLTPAPFIAISTTCSFTPGQ